MSDAEISGEAAKRDERIKRLALGARILSAIVLIPIVLITVHAGGRAFAALVAFLCIVMIFEWTRMVERVEFSSAFYALSAAAIIALFAAPAGAYPIAFGVCALGGAVAYLLTRLRGRNGIWPAMSAAYILAPAIALLWLRLHAENGRAFTYLLFFIVWAADTGAFVTGKFLGGPKISYALSPSKTWAGIAGGIAGGAAIGAAAGAYFFGPQSVFSALIIGGILGAASVLGDLTESALKRRFGKKDISGFIPGHGGVLDRLDGMIFATSTMTSVYFLYMVTEKIQG